MSQKKGFMERAKEQARTQTKLTYLYGGKYNKSCDLTVFIVEDYLQYGIYKLPLDCIQNYSLKQEDQVTEHMKSRLTVTRLALLGPLALAAPKHKLKTSVTVTKYLIIDYVDSEGQAASLVFSGDNCIKFMDTLKTYMPDKVGVSKQSRGSEELKQVNATDPYEELKKAKELLDMGILSQDEFDKKKKELLEL